MAAAETTRPVPESGQEVVNGDTELVEADEASREAAAESLLGWWTLSRAATRSHSGLPKKRPVGLVTLSCV